jgi:hypothetical protein
MSMPLRTSRPKSHQLVEGVDPHVGDVLEEVRRVAGTDADPGEARLTGAWIAHQSGEALLF